MVYWLPILLVGFSTRNALLEKFKQRLEICSDKLREIKPEMWIDILKYYSRDEVSTSRRRLVHILLTRGYLLDNDVPMMWHLIANFSKNAFVSVKHISVEYEQLMDACLEVWMHNGA